MGLLNDFVQTNAQVEAWDRANNAIIKEGEHEKAVKEGKVGGNEYEEIKTFKDAAKGSGVDGKVEFDKPSDKPLDSRSKLYIVIAVVVAVMGIVYLAISNGWFS